MEPNKHKNIIARRWLWAITVILLIAISFVGKNKYNDIYESNINLPPNESTYLFIPTGSAYSDLIKILIHDNLLIDTASFSWVAKQKKLKSFVNPGKYLINSTMSNNDLINIIRSGRQSVVKVSFTKIRTIEKLAGKIGRLLETDSSSVMEAFKNDSLIQSFGFNQNTILSAFIPNTYNFYWNTNGEEFMKRMFYEYEKFWNTKRSTRARDIGMTPIEISTLASIIDEETNKNDEKARIAGVYVNRLKRNIPLGADPTVKFAIGDFSIKRVTKKHLKTKSPYNTYLINGLPPGPICTPSIASIDAVLYYEIHSYLFFCAKDDFSGYHTFSMNLTQHNLNARKYHNALNKRKIFK